MEPSFKLGDKIRILQVPPMVEQKMPPDVVELFRRCVGPVFRIDGIDERGHPELNVAADGAQAPDYCQHTIWIEPEFVVPVD
jgi:hypothetical protein